MGATQFYQHYKTIVMKLKETLIYLIEKYGNYYEEERQLVVDRLNEIYAEMVAKASTGELTVNDFHYEAIPQEFRAGIMSAARKFKNSQLPPEVKAARAARAAATRAANKKASDERSARWDRERAAAKAETERRAAEGYAPMSLGVGEAYGTPKGYGAKPNVL